MLKICGALLLLTAGLVMTAILVKLTGGGYAGSFLPPAALCGAVALTLALLPSLTRPNLNLLKLAGVAWVFAAWLAALTLTALLWQGPSFLALVGLFLTLKSVGAAALLTVAHPIVRAVAGSYR